jgi:hypothetical protein
MSVAPTAVSTATVSAAAAQPISTARHSRLSGRTPLSLRTWKIPLCLSCYSLFKGGRDHSLLYLGLLRGNILAIRWKSPTWSP